MDIENILGQLRSERDRLNEAIIAMERMTAATGLKRRGRPPKWLTEAKAAEAPPASVVVKRSGRPAGKKGAAKGD